MLDRPSHRCFCTRSWRSHMAGSPSWPTMARASLIAYLHSAPLVPLINPSWLAEVPGRLLPDTAATSSQPAAHTCAWDPHNCQPCSAAIPQVFS